MSRPDRLSQVFLAVSLALGTAACSGDISGGASNPPAGGGSPGGGGAGGAGGAGQPAPVPGPPPPANDMPGTAPLRRLTNLEYNNTIRDLLGTPGPADRTFIADQESNLSGFAKGSSINTGTDARQFLNAADQVSLAVKQKLPGLLPCQPLPAAAADQDACAKTFITQFGLRAFRRPLTTEEEADLWDLYTAQRKPDIGADFPEAMREVVAAMLQSPYFLYRWELNQAPTKDGALVKFNSWEMASRLSYFFWASMPDDLLFKAAQANQLQSPDQIAGQAWRLLGDARAKDAIKDFHAQWLNVVGVEDMTKDPTLFKTYNPEVGKAMVAEMGEFVTNVLWGQNASGKLETLLTSTDSFADAGLAKLYGLSGVTGTAMQPVKLNPQERAGILTQGAFLAAHANPGEGHPVRRGKDVLGSLLCIDMAPPTNREVPPLMERQPSQTTREHFAQHSTDPFCASCHSVIDPIGFAFEIYDAVGAYRTTDVGKPVDATGKITLDGMDHTFKDAIDLSGLLAQSNDVRACMAKQWMRYGLRRREVTGEDPSLKFIGDSFKSASFNIRDLMVAFTRTRAFTHRMPSAGEGL
jgi:hypothetical protein